MRRRGSEVQEGTVRVRTRVVFADHNARSGGAFSLQTLALKLALVAVATGVPVVCEPLWKIRING